MTINTVPFNRFLPEVRYQVSGALDAAVHEAVLRSMEDLCKKGWAWEEESAPVDLIAGMSDYDLDVWPDTYVHDLFVFRHRRRLPILSSREIAMREGNGGTHVGEPNGYLRLANATIRLDRVPAQDEANGLRAIAFLMPTENTTDVPEHFWFEHREGVVAGAVARLKAQANKPWFDPETQSSFARQHAVSVEASRIRVFKKYGDGEQRATGRRII